MYGNTLRENREIPCPPVADGRRRAASGSPRTYADDERAREVGQARSTGEVRRTRAGASGWRRGWREGDWPKGTRASKTRPGRRAGQGVHSALERVRRGSNEGQGSSGSPRSCTTSTTWRRSGRPTSALKREAAPGVDGETWRDYGERLEANLQDLSARLQAGGVPGEAGPQGVHPEGGRAAAAARRRRAGGQDRPAGDGRGAERHLRGGLPRLLVRVPAGAQPARCAGCARTVGTH